MALMKKNQRRAETNKYMKKEVKNNKLNAK